MAERVAKKNSAFFEVKSKWGLADRTVGNRKVSALHLKA
jgi:hypothetical protein